MLKKGGKIHFFIQKKCVLIGALTILCQRICPVMTIKNGFIF